MLPKKVWKWLHWASLLFGILLIVLGVVILSVAPHIIHEQIDEEAYLGRYPNGTYHKTVLKWISPKYEMFLQIWTFSVANAKQVMQFGDKPLVIEHGPYTFIEKQNKSWFQFIRNDTRILYRNDRTYFFSQKDSCKSCLLGDKVTVPNILFQKLVDILIDPSTSTITRFALETLIGVSSETAYITVNVSDLLFDGYKDPLVQKICGKPIISDICKKFGVPDRIGLFYGQNGTDDGVYEVNTGLEGIHSIGKVYSWNNMTGTLPKKYWYGDQARMINGSDGQLFTPNLSPSDQIQVFSGKICRSVCFEHNTDIELEGIPAYRFSPCTSMNDPLVQRTQGFCNPKSPVYFKNESVQPVGCAPISLMDVSSCMPSSPRIYISQPHFLDAPKEIHDAIQKLAPPTENDRMFVDIEPSSGAPIRANSVSQVNVGLLNGNLSFLKNMSNAIVPLLWLNETAMLDADTHDQLMTLVTAKRIYRIVSSLFLGFGVLLLLVFSIGIVANKYKTRNNEETDTLVENEQVQDPEEQAYGPIES
uniref:Uncharacterized protein n=1 Tax=Acrobeloides nanus TaxID=290746 RepID=A0A914DUQ4_9BILA